jgi:hypothetical protein
MGPLDLGWNRINVHTGAMTRAFFLYTRSSDVEASRTFYGELIGLEEIWHEAGLDVSYVINDAVQFSIAHDPATPVAQDWAYQPGWVLSLGVEPEPSQAAASWSIPLEPGPLPGRGRQAPGGGRRGTPTRPRLGELLELRVEGPDGPDGRTQRPVLRRSRVVKKRPSTVTSAGAKHGRWR